MTDMSGGMTTWADCMRPAGPAVVAHARRCGAAAAAGKAPLRAELESQLWRVVMGSQSNG